MPKKIHSNWSMVILPTPPVADVVVCPTPVDVEKLELRVVGDVTVAPELLLEVLAVAASVKTPLFTYHSELSDGKS
jgi:hypothetical protein